MQTLRAVYVQVLPCATECHYRKAVTGNGCVRSSFWHESTSALPDPVQAGIIYCNDCCLSSRVKDTNRIDGRHPVMSSIIEQINSQITV